MLDWITGANRSSDIHDGLSDEPPETPAHLFAVKAFKTAIWGTPVPYTHKDPIIGNRSQQPAGRRQNIESKGDGAAIEEWEVEDKPALMKARHADPMASPTKGILVTPGASTAKRKTVSWGGLPQDAVNPALAVEPNDGSKRTQDYQKSLADVERSAKEDLRRSLFQSKAKLSTLEEEGEKESREKLDESNSKASSTSQRNDAETTKAADGHVNHDADVTIDLSSPRSQSGKHWKQEYQREHDASKVEMKKLIQYSQITKAFAANRDSEVNRLNRKWQDADAKVKSMEAKVSDLAAQLMDAKIQDDKQAELVNEVASQTAKALRYKQKAEKYKLALVNEQPLPESTDEETEGRAGGTSHEPKLAELRSEAVQLQKAVTRAETRASELEKENATLKNSLVRVKEEMKKFEVRNKEREARLGRKDEKAAAEKRELQEALEKANAQNAALQQDLDSLRSTNSDPSIDRIQIMRRRLRELEQAGSTSGTPTKHVSEDHLRSQQHGASFKPPIQEDNNIPRPVSGPQHTSSLPENHPPQAHETRIPSQSSAISTSDIWTAGLPTASPLPSPPNNLLVSKSPSPSAKRRTRALSPLINPSALSAHSNNNSNINTVSTSTAPKGSTSTITAAANPNASTTKHRPASKPSQDPVLIHTASPLSLLEHHPSRVLSATSGKTSLPPDRAEAARRRLERRMKGRRASREQSAAKVASGDAAREAKKGGTGTENREGTEKRTSREEGGAGSGKENEVPGERMSE